MEVSEIIKSLKLLITKGTKVSDIEAAIGMPKNNLSSILKETRGMPKKWIQPLEDYINFGSRKMIELPKDFIGVEKIAILRADGAIEEIKDIESLRQAAIVLNIAKDYSNTASKLTIRDIKPDGEVQGVYYLQNPLDVKDCYDGEKSEFLKFDEVGQWEIPKEMREKGDDLGKEINRKFIESEIGLKFKDGEIETFDIEKHNAEIRKQIEAVRAENKPDHIKTSLGEKSWKFDQQKRILELEKQIQK